MTDVQERIAYNINNRRKYNFSSLVWEVDPDSCRESNSRSLVEARRVRCLAFEAFMIPTTSTLPQALE